MSSFFSHRRVILNQAIQILSAEWLQHGIRMNLSRWSMQTKAIIFPMTACLYLWFLLHYKLLWSVSYFWLEESFDSEQINTLLLSPHCIAVNDSKTDLKHHLYINSLEYHTNQMWSTGLTWKLMNRPTVCITKAVGRDSSLWGHHRLCYII